MADRAGERTKTRDVDELLADVDDITTEDENSRHRGSSDSTTTARTAGTTTTATENDESTLRERVGGVFSLKVFVVALVLAAIGSAVGGFVPLIGTVFAFAGVFLATFVLGAVSGRQHYLETGLASALVVGGSTLQNHFYLAFVGRGSLFIAVSVVIGLVCGLLGHYFGRDLRDGLTREL